MINIALGFILGTLMVMCTVSTALNSTFEKRARSRARSDLPFSLSPVPTLPRSHLGPFPLATFPLSPAPIPHRGIPTLETYAKRRQVRNEATNELNVWFLHDILPLPKDAKAIEKCEHPAAAVNPESSLAWGL